MILDILLKKVVRGKDSRVFSHSRFKQFFVASISRSRCCSGYTFCAVDSVCTWGIYRCMACTCVFRVAPRVEYTLAANSADRSLINRSHYQATSECAWPSMYCNYVWVYADARIFVCMCVCIRMCASKTTILRVSLSDRDPTHANPPILVAPPLRPPTSSLAGTVRRPSQSIVDRL